MKTNHDEEAEKKVIGSILTYFDHFCYVFSEMPPEAFYLKRNRDIYEVMAQMFQQGETVDISTLRLKPGMDQHLIYTMELAANYCSLLGFKENVKRLLDFKYKRECFAFFSLSLEGIDGTAPDEIKANLEAFAAKSHEEGHQKAFYTMSEVMDHAGERLDQIKAGNLPYVSTGFRDLDYRIYGFEPGCMYVIGARPGMGKSMLMMEMAKKGKAHAVVFSTEMGKYEIAERLIASESGLPMSVLKRKESIERNETQIRSYMEQIRGYKIMIDDRPIKSVEQIVSDIRYLQLRQQVDIVFIDYLQYLQVPKNKKGRRMEEINHISMALKAASKTLNLPFVVLASMHRFEDQKERKPRPDDLRESGQIESDAHCVMLLYRDPACKELAVEEVEIIVGKSRSAVERPIKLIFNKAKCQFFDAATDPFDQGGM